MAPQTNICGSIVSHLMIFLINFVNFTIFSSKNFVMAPKTLPWPEMFGLTAGSDGCQRKKSAKKALTWKYLWFEMTDGNNRPSTVTFAPFYWCRSQFRNLFWGFWWSLQLTSYYWRLLAISRGNPVYRTLKSERNSWFTFLGNFAHCTWFRPVLLLTLQNSCRMCEPPGPTFPRNHPNKFPEVHCSSANHDRRRVPLPMSQPDLEGCRTYNVLDCISWGIHDSRFWKEPRRRPEPDIQQKQEQNRGKPIGCGTKKLLLLPLVTVYGSWSQSTIIRLRYL